MSEFIVVYVTVGSADEGARVARALVGEGLAACVSRVGPVQSVYRWEGRIEESEEQLLVIKTKRELFEPLQRRVKKLHSYSVPEIIALPIVDGSAGYLKWLEEEVGRDDG